MTRPLPRYSDLPVSGGAPPGSSWGLWGEDDQLGCLNLLTPERARRAAQLVRTGEVFALNAHLDEFDPPLFDRPPLRHEVSVLPRDVGRDEVLDSYNTQASSQWDGFRHIRNRRYGFYNGTPEDRLGIHSWAERGIVGRGVLIDVAGFRARDGRPLAMRDPDPIEVEDLLRAVDEQGCTIEVGDVLVLHTGWLDFFRTNGRDAVLEFAAPGIRPGPAALELLWDWHVSAVAADNPTVEVWPPGAAADETALAEARTGTDVAEVFMHSDLLALLGLPLGELWDTGRLAAACRADQRWDFMFSSAPLRLPGGVASPSNALAIR